MAYLINKTVYYDELGYSLVYIDVDEKNDRFSENELREGARLYEHYCSRAVQKINLTFVIIKGKEKIRVSIRGNNFTNTIPIPEIGTKLGGEGGGHFNAGGVTLLNYKGDIITNIHVIMKSLRSHYKQK